MWDDVIVGSGTKLNGAVKCFDIEGDHSISWNSESFWISDCIMGLGCTIYFDTDQGRFLNALIEQKDGLEKIQSYVDSIILKFISITKLKKAIDRLKRDSFEEGKREKAKEIRKVLGI
jgi:hypothetical protein